MKTARLFPIWLCMSEVWTVEGLVINCRLRSEDGEEANIPKQSESEAQKLATKKTINEGKKNLNNSGRKVNCLSVDEV